MENRERHDLHKMAAFLFENGVRSMVEIGSHFGVSTEIFRDAGISVSAIDPYISGYDKDDGSSNKEKLNAAFEHFSNNVVDGEKIIHIRKTSKEASTLFEDNSLDFVYIDGNHKYASVLEDINTWLPKVRKGMFLGGDDFGRVDKTSKQLDVDKAFLEVLGKPHWMFAIGHGVYRL